jgi:hypothetical protein
VWLDLASPAYKPKLVFGSSAEQEKRMSLVVRVDHCSERDGSGQPRPALWIIDIDTSRATYGVTGPRVRENDPTTPLAPGCYRVSTSGSGHNVFIVEPDGMILELKEARR